MVLPPLDVSPGEMETRVPKRVPRNGDCDIIAFSSKTVAAQASVSTGADKRAGVQPCRGLLFSNKKERVT